jgi:inorganic triphosphatase YgiF
VSRDEVEHCWLAVVPSAQDTLVRLGALREMGAARGTLLPAADLEDLVFEDRGGRLRAGRCTLRLRRWGAERWVTVKGPSRSVPGGAVSRQEFEIEATPAGLAAALRELEAWGGPVAPPMARFAAGAPDAGASPSPEALLLGLGYSVVHRRRTVRARSRWELGGQALAELDLDTVEFAVGAHTVRHREVELELLPGGDPEAFRALADALGRSEQAALEPWPFSKTALGRLLERWEQRGELEDRLGDGVQQPRDELSPAGYAAARAELTAP